MDKIDGQILNALVANGRATYASLGADVGLSPHGVADRVRRLLRTGVITGFTTMIDAAAMGRTMDVMIDVRLMPATQPEDFEAEALRHVAVRELAFVSGRFDYQLRLLCEDADELDRVVRALRQRGGAAQTETRLVMRSLTKASAAALAATHHD